MKAIRSIGILIVAIFALNFLLNHNPFPSPSPVATKAYPEPSICHREADSVSADQLGETIKQMQRSCGMPTPQPPQALTSDQIQRACEDLKKEGFIDDIANCIANENNSNGWSHR